MGWLIAIGLAAAVIGGLWRFGGFPKGTIELLAAAVLLGLAGYAWQGSPGYAGRPTRPPQPTPQAETEFARDRDMLMDRIGSDAQILDSADAFHQRGLNDYAVGILRGAVQRRPRSADLWVGLGNALVIHGGGMMSPAAQFAFERAARLSPQHPGPPFFMGLAYAQAGQPDRAAEVWRGLLARAPAAAPWRADLEQRLAQLEVQGIDSPSPRP